VLSSHYYINSCGFSGKEDAWGLFADRDGTKNKKKSVRQFQI
jgi:hypothetical protein